MKNLIFFILIIFFYTISFNVFAQEQISEPNDWIRQQDGIPIVGSMHWHWLRDNPDAVKDMKTAGVDVLRFHVEDVNHVISFKGHITGLWISIHSRKCSNPKPTFITIQMPSTLSGKLKEMIIMVLT